MEETPIVGGSSPLVPRLSARDCFGQSPSAERVLVEPVNFRHQHIDRCSLPNTVPRHGENHLLSYRMNRGFRIIWDESASNVNPSQDFNF